VLILRPIEPRDADALLDLARQLDSMNLPAEPGFLAERIALSQRSFAHEIADWREGIYVFVLEDSDAGRCVGTSTILAKHGRPGQPYFWLEVTNEVRRSHDLGVRFEHKKLQLRSTEDGPTEIGGIVLEPGYRRHKARCGKSLSIVRFAYMSMHPGRFEREVIAEMLSPFEEGRRNLLWDAFGKHFTGLSYREADHLSSRSKQFIADLFPRDPVYATLFPERVQASIGQANDTAVAALRILEKIGFRQLCQVDPFDGGPYVGASRDAIASVNQRTQLVLPGLPTGAPETDEDTLVLIAAEGSHGFRATMVPTTPDGSPYVPASAREALGVEAGNRVSITPLP
jgi:arginine N-succinyltransferase